MRRSLYHLGFRRNEPSVGGKRDCDIDEGEVGKKGNHHRSPGGVWPDQAAAFKGNRGSSPQAVAPVKPSSGRFSDSGDLGFRPKASFRRTRVSGYGEDGLSPG
ncbi:hypothetical protein L1987_54749 [Smallanthus sonchifolius]|uniref:Uncharacterized protein n=1 Tax=Smallanthus sonchifolius TaxID=185202 RepID=A0ACB9E832_9ASTR|nr:hypothetical protein L1987_54749 [Smallanthus sonchifolius]